MARTFIPNPLIGVEIEASGMLLLPLDSTAETIADRARNLAPVDTGTYRNSIQADSGMENGKSVGQVSSDVPYAAFIEFGTSDTPTFAVLRRASEGS